MAETTTMQTDDLNPGLIVTVLSHKRTILSSKEYEDDDDETDTTETLGAEDLSCLGDVLEILAVDLPYLIVANHSCLVGQGEPHRLTLDSRRTKFKELSAQYVFYALGTFVPVLT